MVIIMLMMMMMSRRMVMMIDNDIDDDSETAKPGQPQAVTLIGSTAGNNSCLFSMCCHVDQNKINNVNDIIFSFQIIPHKDNKSFGVDYFRNLCFNKE